MSEVMASSGTVKAASAAQAAEPHPCLNRNNTNKKDTHPGWKTGYLVRTAILNLVAKLGLDNIGMYTFTFADVPDLKEAYRRWNSFNTGVLSKRYDHQWIKTTELQKRGSPHFHWIGHVPGIRVGARLLKDHRINSKGQRRGVRDIMWAPRGTVLWEERDFLNDVLPRYGFGTINDISPIISTAEAAAAYAAKYVTKSFGSRPESLKGARLVSFGKGIRPGSAHFSSVGGKAKIFREGVELFCLKHNLEWEDLPIYCDAIYGKPGGKCVGHRWAYFMREDFQKAWQEFASQQPF